MTKDRSTRQWEKNIKYFLKENFSMETNNIDLYKEAMMHGSSGYPNNQRLAFLGDEVLNFIIKEHFFRDEPEWDRDKLTKKCDSIKSNKNFAIIARGIKLKKCIKFGETYDNRPEDTDNETINAEALEALFGAIYLDKGLNQAKKITLEMKII
jgi:ribonuclease-3